MAVLLLYTLQLAVNTVKGPPPTGPRPRACAFLSVRRCSAFLAGFPPTLAAPGAGRVVAARQGPLTGHQIQSIAAFISKGFLLFLFFPCFLNTRESTEGWKCLSSSYRALIPPPLEDKISTLCPREATVQLHRGGSFCIKTY